MPPVDQAAGPVQGGELVKGVVGPGVDEQPVGVVEPAHGRGDVHERVVGVLPRPGGGDRVVGQCPQVLSHAARLTGLGPLAGLDGGGNPPGASVEVGHDEPQPEQHDPRGEGQEEPGGDLRGVQALRPAGLALEAESYIPIPKIVTLGSSSPI